MCQNFTHGKFIFFEKEIFQCRPSLTTWTPVFSLFLRIINFFLRILLGQWAHAFNSNIIIVKTVSQLKCLDERKRYLLNDLAFRSIVGTRETYLEAFLAMVFWWFWKENDPTNQKLPTTFLAYILPWYTQTWLSAYLLTTLKFVCCVAFQFFQK